MTKLHLLIGIALPLLTISPAANAQSESPPTPDPPQEAGQAPATAPGGDTITLPDNAGESKPNLFTDLLSFLGLPRPGEHARPGATYFAYSPTNGTIRDLFGDQWSGGGPAFGRLPVPRSHAVLATELSFVTSSRNGNRATLVPFGATYTSGFGDERTRGTVGVGAGLLFLESRVPSRNLPSRWRGGMNGSAFAGIAFGGSGSVQLGYRWAERIRGFDMSGTSLDVSFRF